MRRLEVGFRIAVSMNPRPRRLSRCAAREYDEYQRETGAAAHSDRRSAGIDERTDCPVGAADRQSPLVVIRRWSEFGVDRALAFGQSGSSFSERRNVE
ncbi:MAG: hypothetical protein KIT84_44225 [Labilithrix sp.]|nr:hypothetical protein [Labilithrix sp.]MCW5818087.1 hypothetical protein [Labilithrix sp.]